MTDRISSRWLKNVSRSHSESAVADEESLRRKESRKQRDSLLARRSGLAHDGTVPIFREVLRAMSLALLLGTLAWPLAGQGTSKVTTADGKQAKRQENSTDSEAHAPASGGRQGVERYRLQPGDTVELSFAFTPDFNQTLSIGPDGFATLREVGDVQAEGYTTDELAQTAESRYARILHDPMVTVTLKDFDKPYFIVGGEVEHPGKFELRGRTTLTEAVAIAGGFRDTAKHSDVLLFRRVSNDWASARKIDLKAMLRAGNLSEDPELEPGDMLFVPKNTISKIKPFIPVVGLGAYVNPARF